MFWGNLKQATINSRSTDEQLSGRVIEAQSRLGADEELRLNATQSALRTAEDLQANNTIAHFMQQENEEEKRFMRTLLTKSTQKNSNNVNQFLVSGI